MLYHKHNTKTHFLSQAKLFAQSLDPQKVQQLNGNLTDVSLPAYQQLTERMQAVKQVLPDVRFAYLMKEVNQQIIFISDSEPPSSSAASAYGQVYSEASPEFRKMFSTGEPLLEGPLHDRWGHWVSAHAAITDSQGQVIAVVGMDMDASDWLAQMRWYQITAFLMLFLLLTLFCLSVVFYLAMRRWREAEAENRYRAIHDALTGLHNRFFMHKTLAHTITQYQKIAQKFAILYIDLDGLKQINERLGHTAGDLLIQEVAARICKQLKRSGRVGRLGGDEFLAILTDVDDIAQARIVATHLQHAICLPLESAVIQGLTVSCRIGIALFPDDAEHVDALLLHADADMYQSKRQSDGFL
ncbi:MAG: diguanylate cyclase [Pseudomonadota bacterium]|nr:diguanylate cyclase [Pseudomonadota bacterium]